MNSSSIKKILILVTILAVPGFLYYLLQDKGKNRYKPLPIYGPKEVASTSHTVRGKEVKDTIYHVIKDFQLVNQANDTLNWKSFEGKILVFNLFYTGAGNQGRIANDAITKLNKTYQKNTLIRFVSLSVDLKDKPQTLNAYAKLLSAEAGKWDLLTGDSIQVYGFIKDGLLLDALHKTEQGQSKFIYSNMFVLLDAQHRIRGYYDAGSHEAMAKLDDEMRVLIAEDLRNLRDGR